MITTNFPAVRAAATLLTFAAQPGGGFPAVLIDDHAEVIAPAGGEPMHVLHRYEDLLGVKGSAAWRMANRFETPLTGAEVPGNDPPGHLLGMDGPGHRKLRQAIGHLFTSDAADALRPQMRQAAASLLGQISAGSTGELRTAYTEPAAAATVCAALGVPAADWAPILRPAGEIAFGVVQPGGVINALAAWDALWGYYERVIAAKQASPDGEIVAQMFLAMERAGYSLEEVVRAVATVSNGATALLPVLERVLLWLLQRPEAVAGVFLGECTWAQVVREAIVAGALFPVTPPLVAGKGARIGRSLVPEGTVALPSLVSAVRHPRGGAWLAFGAGRHRCPGDELALAALEEYAEAFFCRFPCAHLVSPVLEWRDGPLSTPREAGFAVGRLPAAAGAGHRPRAGTYLVMYAPRSVFGGVRLLRRRFRAHVMTRVPPGTPCRPRHRRSYPSGPGSRDLAAYIRCHDRAYDPLGYAHGRVAWRPVAGRRPGHGPADGACAPLLPG